MAVQAGHHQQGKRVRERAGATHQRQDPHGRQHATLVSFGGSMRRRGAGAEEIFAVLSAMNRLRCKKPGPDTSFAYASNMQIGRNVSFDVQMNQKFSTFTTFCNGIGRMLLNYGLRCMRRTRLWKRGSERMLSYAGSALRYSQTSRCSTARSSQRSAASLSPRVA
jgi:hypothetical protein